MNDIANAHTRPNLEQVALTWGIFGLLLPAALVFPELQTAVTLFRAKYTIWVSITLAIPAYVLLVQGGMSATHSSAYQYWRLFWTFSFLAYATHFYYVFCVMYRGSVAGVVEQQTRFVAWSNFLFTAWWAADVALHWLMRTRPLWLSIERWSFQIFSFATFVTAFVFLRPGAPFYFGVVLIIATAFSLMIRLLRQPASASSS
jgi:hypothetical protein